MLNKTKNPRSEWGRIGSIPDGTFNIIENAVQNISGQKTNEYVHCIIDGRRDLQDLFRYDS